MLSDGRFRSESFGQDWFAGKTAVLQADNVTLVVTSRPVHLFDRSLFLRPWSGSETVRPGRGEVAALPTAYVCRLVRTSDQRGCAR